jgi:hypothetical protein
MNENPTPRSESDLLDAMLAQLATILGKTISVEGVDFLPIAGAAGATRSSFPDATTMTNRWTAGIQAKAQNWVDGIQNPRRNFKEAALANKDRWKTGVTQAVTNDSYAKGMQAVDDNQAIATAVAIGASGYQSGALARAPKFTAKMNKWVPLAQAAVNAVRAKPAVTDADKENRAVEMIRAFRAAGKTMK